MPIYLDKYAIFSVVWLITLYVATALTAGVDASPEGGLALILFEARHVVMHSLVFAVQAWLIARALRVPHSHGAPRTGTLLVTLVLTLGIGQEVLQSLYRCEIRVLPSLWDLVVDTMGGIAGWWWYKHRLPGFAHTVHRK
jgi:hypothetical protein